MASADRAVQRIDQLMDYVNEGVVTLPQPKEVNISNGVLQLILSFTGLYEMRVVCKKWRDLCQKNEDIFFKALYAPYKKNPNGGILIVHSRRSRLNTTESEYGYQGPFQSISAAIISSSNGDMILVHPGRYNQFDAQSDQIRSNIAIIGIGSNPQDVVWEDPSPDSSQFIHIDAIDVRIAKLTVESTPTDDGIQGAVYIAQLSHVTMSECILNFHQTGVMVRDTASFTATNCQFVGGSTGIEISPLAEIVSVQKCMFHGLGQMTGAEENVTYPAEEYGCIQVFDDFRDIGNMGSHFKGQQLTLLKCTDNIFEDNFCYPVSERSNDRRYVCSNQYTLTGNIFCGFNGTMTRKGQLHDANQLYHCYWG